MVQKVLMPSRGMGRRKGTDANSKKIHVEEGYLGPRVEGRSETKLCAWKLIELDFLILKLKARGRRRVYEG